MPVLKTKTRRSDAPPQNSWSVQKPQDSTDAVLMAYCLIALNLQARRELALVARRRMKLERDLDDPALAGHPKRPRAERLHAQRSEEERAATIRLAELNAALAQQWAEISAADKNRYALTDIIAADPEQDIGLVLWCDDRGLARLAPFPNGWAVPADISHRVLDSPEAGKTSYTREELLNAPAAPF